MALELSGEEAEIAVCKSELRQLGYYVRYTEWPLGHQVVIHARADTSKHLVTEWHRTELQAWQAALRLGLIKGEVSAEPAAPEIPS